MLNCSNLKKTVCFEGMTDDAANMDMLERWMV